jgi:hypothetical protein
VTLGAGATSLPCGGNLESAPNRSADTGWKNAINLEKVQYPPALEDALISLLLQLEAAYDDKLPYDCFPETNDVYYNSNGFVHGLLNAADLPEPQFPIEDWFPYRGWTKPVPTWKFTQP